MVKLFRRGPKQPHIAADLSTADGRRRAETELIWGDHGFLRMAFQNLHQIDERMWRSNQPSPKQIEEHAKERGIKTILNLRGETTKGYYLLEKEACEANGITLINCQVFSRDTPTVEAIHTAKELFKSIDYPALMHCKSGADRAGLMAVLYAIFELDQPVEEAIEQLSKKYLHMREGKTGLLDAFFEAYLEQGAPKGQSFLEWIETDYDRMAVKQAFLDAGRDRLGLDRLLRRE